MVNGAPGSTLHIDIYRRAFDAISNPVTILDIEKKVLWCNKAMAELVGKPLTAIVGLPVCPLIDPPGSHTANCVFRQAKEPAVFFLANRWFFITGEDLADDSGHITGYVHIMNDITERRKAEEEIKKQHEQLLHADKMISLGILASGMAHEINNPNN